MKEKSEIGKELGFGLGDLDVERLKEWYENKIREAYICQIKIRHGQPVGSIRKHKQDCDDYLKN